ncbi:MAG: hypothetical protein HYU57_05715 [Micavibrio aeruginosavorus]|nr:hypothetical protein [Micavibrio aeruginosavorus]
MKKPPRYCQLRAAYAPLIAAALLRDPLFGQDGAGGDAARALRLKQARGDGVGALQDMALCGPVFDAFARQTDPTATRSDPGSAFKYLGWICRVWLAAGAQQPMLVEDLYKIRGDLQNFITWKRRLAQDGRSTDIADYASLDALGAALAPYKAARDLRRAKRLAPLQDGATLVHGGAEGRIYLIHTWEAAKILGAGTEWCVSMKHTDSHFIRHHAENPIFFYILPQQDPLGRQIKYAGTGTRLYDINDKNPRGVPPALSALISAARAALGAEERSILDAHGGYRGYAAPGPLQEAAPNAGTPAPRDTLPPLPPGQDSALTWLILEIECSPFEDSSGLRPIDRAHFADPLFMRHALRRSSKALQWADPALRGDPAFLRACLGDYLAAGKPEQGVAFLRVMRQLGEGIDPLGHPGLRTEMVRILRTLHAQGRQADAFCECTRHIAALRHPARLPALADVIAFLESGDKPAPAPMNPPPRP